MDAFIRYEPGSRGHLQGFIEDNRFESTLGDNRYLIFSLVAEDAPHIVYKPGTHGSALTIDSQCITDPAMDEPTG
ncbi:hypothetical protein [Arthrobacter sp. USHLN218]|uniref:hypothetical protein n=1 Tax=Arthrobacter sp. USHLN218 TaxID=3081232 RepID=UPI003017386C